MRNAVWPGLLLASVLGSGCEEATPLESPHAPYVVTTVELRGDAPPLVEQVVITDNPQVERAAAAVGIHSVQQSLSSVRCGAAGPPLALFAGKYYQTSSGVICFSGTGTARLDDYERLGCTQPPNSPQAPYSCTVLGTWAGRVRSFRSYSAAGSFAGTAGSENFASWTDVVSASSRVMAANEVNIASYGRPMPDGGMDGSTYDAGPNLPLIPCSRLTRAAACGTHDCGTALDGCGGTYSCGSCPLDQCLRGHCYAPASTACGPRTCSSGTRCCDPLVGLCALSCP